MSKQLTNLLGRKVTLQPIFVKEVMRWREFYSGEKDAPSPREALVDKAGVPIPAEIVAVVREDGSTLLALSVPRDDGLALVDNIQLDSVLLRPRVS